MEDPITQQINKLLETLEESNLLLKRAMSTCDQIERELKVRLNERMQVI
jgi:hypothetical protein